MGEQNNQQYQNEYVRLRTTGSFRSFQNDHDCMDRRQGFVKIMEMDDESLNFANAL